LCRHGRDFAWNIDNSFDLIGHLEAVIDVGNLKTVFQDKKKHKSLEAERKRRKYDKTRQKQNQ